MPRLVKKKYDSHRRWKSSSRKHVMNYNCSATKQCFYLQSVAEISHHTVLSGDRIRQCGTSFGSCHKDTDQCKSPFPSASTSVSLFRAKTVQQRPLLPREVKTRLPDHLSRLPVMPPSTFDVNWLQVSHSSFLDVRRSNGGLRISGWIGQLSCLTIFSTSLSVAVFLHRAGSSMLESTGSHSRGVEWRVPEI